MEVVAGLVAALVVWSSPDPGTLLAAAWIAAFGIVLCFVDVAVHRLPDPLTRWALVGAGLILTVTAALTSRHDRLVSAVGGATILGGFYLAMAVARPRSLGLGDAKLALPIGLFLGWLGLRFVLSGLLAITMIGTATGLVLLAVGRLRRGQGFAHGPALCAGALITYISVAEP